MAWQRSATLLFLAWPCFALADSGSACISQNASSENNLDCNENKAVFQVNDREFEVDTSYYLTVVCLEDEFKIRLPAGPLSGVRILGPQSMFPVLEAPKSCGYSLRRGKKHNTLTVSYTGCLVTLEAGYHNLRVSYVDDGGILDISDVSCDADPPMSTITLPIIGGHPKPRALQPTMFYPLPNSQNPTTSPVEWEGDFENASYEHHNFDDISDEVTFRHNNLDYTDHDYSDGKALVQLVGDPVFQPEFEVQEETIGVTAVEAAPVSLAVLCIDNAFKVMLPAGPLSQVKILGFNNTLPVLEAPGTCGYSLSQEQNQNALTVRFSGCLVSLQDGQVSFRVSYVNESGVVVVSKISCEFGPKSSVSPTTHLAPPDVLQPHARPNIKLPNRYAPPEEPAEKSLSSARLVVLCSEDEFKVTLPAGPLSQVKILGSDNTLPVLEAPGSCGYSLSEGQNQNTLTVRFSGCLVSLKAGRFTFRVSYVNESGVTDVSNISCEVRSKSSVSSNTHLPPNDDLQPRARLHSKLPSHYDIPRLRHKHHSRTSGCSIPRSQHVPCGFRYSRMSSSQCLAMGCCLDSATSACFYPMDECTADKHFVFVIHRDITKFPVDPTSLMVVGKSNCGPVIVNNKFAVFKFSVTRCGTHSYEIGETMIYTAEVQTTVRTLNLKYGAISRDNLVRIMVECRYSKEGVGTWPAFVRLGYMVKSPSLSSHSKVTSEGQFGVQLRIAEDSTYETYLEQYHQPLRLLLGNPVYLEVRLKSPRPDATLLVNYCLAYPRSAKKALVLIHEGCANPLDATIAILKFRHLHQNRHQRRFMVQAFQFMDQHSNKYLNEEIYFMCSTEVCMPKERTCKQRCFDGKA
ncbi:hypothetical protein UPYG_G00082360 [Umbra pygmaea]|uniref:Uncharacterized protein n=1 Tax=Umbra pygmaea TaxID=75934 RepID=A0ABD0XDY0_UMBPY